MDTAAPTRDLKRLSLDGEVIDPDHRDYDTARKVWNAMADRRPGVVVRARSVADVEKVVSAAAEHGALLAVRGGGHSIPGISTCDDGIMLDLSEMNAVGVDPAAGRAEAQGGALLGDLDRAGVPAGLVVPAGVVSHTGVAGLTLGGGMGWLSRRLGLTVDSLLAVDLVTADGRSRHVSAESDPDLFWAIRGGGGNFGVATKFTFKTHPLEHVLVGTWVYPVAEAGAALAGYRELAAAAPRALSTGLIFTNEGLLITAIWSGDAAPAERAVAPFGGLGRPVSAALGGVSFLELQSRNDDHMAWNRRYYAKGGYLREIDERAIACMVECIAEAPSAGSEFYILQLGGAVSDIGEDATAFTGRAAGHYWIAESGWDHEADDEAHVAWNRMAGARLAEISMRGNYVNEQSEVGKEVARGAYGAGKYDRLARLKARYDPANLFRLNQNIEPKS